MSFLLTHCVMIPPPVGPTVRRVAYVIRIGLCPRFGSEDLPRVVVSWSSPVDRTFSVVCHVSRRCLPAYYQSNSVCSVGLYLYVICSYLCACLCRGQSHGCLLAWYYVSHDGLPCTTIGRTIVLMIRPWSADAPRDSTMFHYYQQLYLDRGT